MGDARLRSRQLRRYAIRSAWGRPAGRRPLRPAPDANTPPEARNGFKTPLEVFSAEVLNSIANRS
ncbi:hypothetical protein EYC54_17445 [Xanthomonas oryzae]|nr:hypothetical protein EYC54_17445 [Xanthomonas oryzae]